MTHTTAPPILPPKPSGHDVVHSTLYTSRDAPSTAGAATRAEAHRIDQDTYAPWTPDPGEEWLPQVLENKSKQDIADVFAQPELLRALTQAPSTIHPSLSESHAALESALVENLDMAATMLELESRLSHKRSTTQAQLLSTHALERQWRLKQSEMDLTLAPFLPASLYQGLTQGLQEQAMVCHALEESFLDSYRDGSEASERDVIEWVRKYKETKAVYYLRQERKNRWDEGRVGGWRS